MLDWQAFNTLADGAFADLASAAREGLKARLALETLARGSSCAPSRWVLEEIGADLGAATLAPRTPGERNESESVDVNLLCDPM